MYVKQYHFIYLPYLLEDINSLVGNILENLKKYNFAQVFIIQIFMCQTLLQGT